MTRVAGLGLILILLFGCNSTAPLRSDLDELRSAINTERQMLEDYYGQSHFLFETWLDGQATDLDYLSEKFARALVWQDRFVIATLGSSVTVGDGNCRYDNYQNQLSRLIGPLLQIADVDLEIRNSAQGGECGDSHQNQVWCIDSLAGENVDIIHYSWTYFEAGDRQKEQVHEQFYRWSLMQPGAPVPQILYASGCEQVTLQDRQLLDAYRPFSSNMLCMTRAMVANGWQGKVWGEVGDTLHTTTRYGESPEVSEARRDSLGVVFRNWHPGPLLYQTTSDTLAYNYMQAMLIAIDKIEASDDPFSDWPERHHKGLASTELPEVLVCDESICGLTSAPSCLTYSHPTFGESKIRWQNSDDSVWQKYDHPVFTNYPEKDQNLPQCQYEHHCGGLTASSPGSHNPLSFELPAFERGFVGVCCMGKQCGQKLLEAGLIYRLNNQPITTFPSIMRANKCVQVQSRADKEVLQRDTNTLTIEFPEGVSVPPITHVLAL